MKWSGAALEIKGTNPQWEDLAVNEVFTAAPEPHASGYGQGAYELLEEWVDMAEDKKSELKVPQEVWPPARRFQCEHTV